MLSKLIKYIKNEYISNLSSNHFLLSLSQNIAINHNRTKLDKSSKSN